MTDIPNLNGKQIFAMPVGDHLGVEKEDCFLVYSPLAGKSTLATARGLARMESSLASGMTSEDAEMADVMRDLLQYDRISGYSAPSKELSEVTKLSILPTYRCNFSCSYCYSRQGRSDEALDREKITMAIDHFIDPGRLQGRKLFMAILGGGEPLLRWDLVEHAIMYARERSTRFGFTLGIGLTTNGSVISERMLQVLKHHQVQASVSFEILERIQNQQRRQYREVCRTIDQLCDAGIDVTIKSIITPLNVGLLQEMAQELVRRFPAVRSLKLQPVEDDALFPSPEALRSFLNYFTAEFFVARAIGDAAGVDIHCPAFRNMDFIMEHYCGGEMCLTPAGTISVCHRVSSPKEKEYERFIYGSAGKDGIYLDPRKFDLLMDHDLHTDERCRNCFSRWHCGGGCLATAATYDDTKLAVVCEWTRDFMALALLYRLQKYYHEEQGVSLREFVVKSLSDGA